MMTYSWYNINDISYQNSIIKYTQDSGANWHTIDFPNGTYTYDDISEYIQDQLIKNNHATKENVNDKIKITFNNSTYRCFIKLGTDFQLDLRAPSNFNKLIGFTQKIANKSEYGTNLLDITSSVDSLHITCSEVVDSIVGGERSSTIFVINVDDLRRSYPFTVIQQHLHFNRLRTNILDEIEFNVRDVKGRPVILNGIEWSMILTILSIYEQQNAI